MGDTFKCKTDKNGGFELTHKVDVPYKPCLFCDTKELWATKVSIEGKLTKPDNMTVEGTLTFNGGSKKVFKKKTGEPQDFGEFALKHQNTLVLEGKVATGEKDKVAPPKAGTELIFEVTTKTS